MKIGFIGLGKLGMPCAEEIAKKGHAVLGYDVDKSLNSDYVIVEETIKEVAEVADIVFVAVPTPHDPNYDGKAPTAHLEPKDFQYDIVIDCLKEANKYMNKKQMLVLISTVLPGTVRREFVPLITNTRFVYNPYLIAMGTVAWDMVNPEMVIIGTKDGSLTGDAELLLDFYRTFIVDGTRYEVGTWDEAEAIKIFYNTFISTKVALVNMMQDVAERSGNMNVDVVTQALERSTYRITGKTYMKAGMGDGGGCHPRDNIALRYMAEELGLGYDLFDAIMRAREVQAKNMADKLVEISKENNLPIIILGQSYKPDVDYLDGSSSILTAHYIKEQGIVPEFDQPHPYKAVYLLGHMGKHHDYNFPKDSIVVDPWRSFKSDNIKVIHYGNTRFNY